MKKIRSNGTPCYPTVASGLDIEEGHRTLRRKVEMLLACWEISVGGKPKVATLLGYGENPHRHFVSSSRKPYSSIWALLLGCGRKAIYSVQILLPFHATLGETPYYNLWYHTGKSPLWEHPTRHYGSNDRENSNYVSSNGSADCLEIYASATQLMQLITRH